MPLYGKVLKQHISLLLLFIIPVYRQTSFSGLQTAYVSDYTGIIEVRIIGVIKYVGTILCLQTPVPVHRRKSKPLNFTRGVMWKYRSAADAC